jgi:hypothetical protein
MPYLKIVIREENEEAPAFPEVNNDNFLGNIELIGAAILEGGMQSGKTAIGLMLKTPDGKYLFAETSGEIIENLGMAVKGANMRFADKKAGLLP